MGQPSNRTIVGVSILLFTCVLAGVGIHHLVKTGTCSSTGYASNYGPVPYCPSGTGWWIGFLMIGIFGSIIGGFMAGGSTVGLINGGIFSAIGFGSLSVIFDKHASSMVFAGVFGGAFALVGGTILLFVLAAALRSVRPSSRRPSGSRSRSSPGAASRTTSVFGASSAFGRADKNADPILGAYAAGRQGTGSADGALAGTGLSTSSLSDTGLGSLDPSPAASHGGDELDSLSKLSDLHKSGALTDEEFAREKAKLLGS